MAYFLNIFFEVKIMSQNRNTAQQVLLEVLGNYFITGHRYSGENKIVGAWIFSAPKNKRKFLNSRMEEVKLSMLNVKSPIMLDKTVQTILKNNLRDTFFNEKGEFETYSIAMPIRDILGDNNALKDLENKKIDDFIAGADAQKLHDINTQLLESCSALPEYTSFLEEVTQSFLNDSQQINPFPNLDVNGYLTSIVEHSRNCQQQYEATKLGEQVRSR